jgi:hypothetical protein
MKMTTRSLVNGVAAGSAATLALAFGAVDRAQAATLFSDTFNTENGGIANNGTLSYTGFANWDVTGGNVDLIGTNSFDLYPGNGLYVDLNGVTQGAITTKQSYSITDGDVTFSYGTNDGTAAIADVFFGTTKLGSISNVGSGSSFSTGTFSIANLSGQLSFRSITGTAGGIVVDNIVLNESTAVPEPSDLMGTVFALGSVVALKRKFGKK